MTFSSALVAYQSSSRHSLKTDLVGCSFLPVIKSLESRRTMPFAQFKRLQGLAEHFVPDAGWHYPKLSLKTTC
jgi:hypothetical protein